MPSTAFDAKSESPITTTRVSGLGASLSAAGAAAVTGADTAAAIEIGPFLSLPSSYSTGLPASAPFRSVSAQLRGLVWTMLCAVCPLTASVVGDADRASGNAVSTEKRSVIGCGGYAAATGTVGSPMRPLMSTTTSLPTSIAQSCASVRRLANAGASALSGGSISRSSLPPFSRYFFNGSISGGG